jgi:phosphopantothenoylcysteine decarboxylase/phosphopantothenate--cysteine ligase
LSALAGKKIILGVCGSIAAYKSALIVRGLIAAGAEVRVLMTPAATDFITPLSLATLSRNEVVSSVHSGESWNNHVELGLWADAFLIAPATATTLAKLASGLCDNALVAVYLSARCPVFFAPAMDVDMWEHPATRANVVKLTGYGNHLIDVESGELASGLTGKGRLAEPERIIRFLSNFFGGPVNARDLTGRRILITAGPTVEDIDPVRYFSNRSTGRMGIALAEGGGARGAEVTLILGPTSLSTSHPGVEVIRVRSAREMHERCLEHWPACTDGILAAAVADYRPAEYHSTKIKKGEGDLPIQLTRNPDIAADLGRRKEQHQRLIGFALETENGEANARRKLREKNLDLIVLNPTNDTDAGFGHVTNRITLISNNKVEPLELKSKRAAADDILDSLLTLT